ncbi:hypothetical protein KCU59_g36, partial [Aureobasidium melanogenum]
MALRGFLISWETTIDLISNSPSNVRGCTSMSLRTVKKVFSGRFGFQRVFESLSKQANHVSSRPRHAHRGLGKMWQTPIGKQACQMNTVLFRSPGYLEVSVIDLDSIRRNFSSFFLAFSIESRSSVERAIVVSSLPHVCNEQNDSSVQFEIGRIDAQRTVPESAKWTDNSYGKNQKADTASQSMMSRTEGFRAQANSRLSRQNPRYLDLVIDAGLAQPGLLHQ